jgi:hypothetical protein
MWPFKKKPEPTGDGVLFGFNPPDGCHFQVRLFGGNAWFVHIWRGEVEIVYDLALVGGFGESTSEKAVKKAARGVLAKFALMEATAELEGCYPPKRTPL